MLSTAQQFCGVDNRVPQLPQTCPSPLITSRRDGTYEFTRFKPRIYRLKTWSLVK